MHLMTRNRLTRIAAGCTAALVAAGLLVAPALAEEKVERKVKIKVVADGMNDAEAIDVSDLAVGETRWVSTSSGKDVGITREDDGYRISIDGEETFVVSPEAGAPGMHRRMAVHSGHGDGEAHQVFVRRIGTEEGGDQNMVFVTDQDQVIDLQGLSDMVFITGLGDLDESRKQAIIDALRGAGVDKEIRFAPAAGHGFHFISGEGVAPGEDVDVNVQKIITGDGESPQVIVIEKVEKKQE